MTPVRRIVWYVLTAALVQLAVMTIILCCGGYYWSLLGVDCFLEVTSTNSGNAAASAPQYQIIWNAVCVLLVVVIWVLSAAGDLALVSMLFRFTSRYFDRTAMASALIFALTAFLCASSPRQWSSSSWQWSYDTPARQFSVDFDREFYTTYFAVTVESPLASSTYPPLRWENLTFLGLGYVYANNLAGRVLVRRFYVSLWYALSFPGSSRCCDFTERDRCDRGARAVSA